VAIERNREDRRGRGGGQVSDAGASSGQTTGAAACPLGRNAKHSPGAQNCQSPAERLLVSLATTDVDGVAQIQKPPDPRQLLQLVGCEANGAARQDCDDQGDIDHAQVIADKQHRD